LPTNSPPPPSPSATDTLAAAPDAGLFRIHFENQPGPAYIFRRSGDDFVLIAHNRAAAALQHSDVSKSVGLRSREMLVEGGHDLKLDLERAVTQGVVVKREVDHRYWSTGTMRRLALCAVPLTEDVVVLHTDDVTDQRRIAAALTESERQYRTIVDTAHEGIWAVDVQSTITYVNLRAAEMLGYLPDEMLDRSMFDFVDEPLREEARKILQRLATGLRARYDFRLRHKTGRKVWVSVAASPLLDKADAVIGMIHMIADIDDRKRAEQALRESEAKVRALLDANPDMIVRVSRDGTYLDVHIGDPGARNYLPRPASDFVGRTVEEIFGTDFARTHEYYRLRALSTGKIQRWEYERLVKGEERYVEARFVKSGEDEVVITVRDITRQVELEREVVASAERERTRIGHDLHDGLAQVLIGVKWILESLRDKLGAADSPYQGEAAHAADLVRKVIAQTGELAQGLSPIPKGGRLGDALRQLADQSQQLLGVPCGLTVTDLPRDLDEISAAHLYRIAQEAITNAVKHGRATSIDVVCQRVPGSVRLSISDNGCGIADTGSESRGMGLHIMRYRARAIGAELAVANRAEGGTMVQCSYPLSATPYAANGSGVTAERASTA
jgi:PAS domain S-box-containing protein